MKIEIEVLDTLCATSVSYDIYLNDKIVGWLGKSGELELQTDETNVFLKILACFGGQNREKELIITEDLIVKLRPKPSLSGITLEIMTMTKDNEIKIYN